MTVIFVCVFWLVLYFSILHCSRKCFLFTNLQDDLFHIFAPNIPFCRASASFGGLCSEGYGLRPKWYHILYIHRPWSKVVQRTGNRNTIWDTTHKMLNALNHACTLYFFKLLVKLVILMVTCQNPHLHLPWSSYRSAHQRLSYFLSLRTWKHWLQNFTLFNSIPSPIKFDILQ